MASVNPNFFTEVGSFVNKHKVLCALTLGLAIVGYSLGNLAGRTVSWISQCRGTTKKSDNIGQEAISSFQKPLKPSSESTDQLTITSRPKIEEFIETLQSEDGVQIKGSQEDDWHEIVFDNQPYEKSQVKCSWKLHISPGSDSMAVLNAIKPILLKHRPYCKIVPNREKLIDSEKSLDVNGKRVYKGKCLTIYPKCEAEALMLATELNKAINEANLINSDYKQMPCTDRPLGLSGYLWSRNDLAGGPITEEELQSSDHAHAMAGNYDTTVILPMKAYDFQTDKRGRQAYNKWYEREFPNFKRFKHKDIFEESFGVVHWVGGLESDQGRFETV